MKTLLLTLLIAGAVFATNTSNNETVTVINKPISIPNTPVDFNILLAMVLIFVGLYAMLYYALNLLSVKKR